MATLGLGMSSRSSPGIRRFDAAVEEVGDVGVLLGLGDVELAPAGLGEGLGERARLLGPEGDEDRQAGLVFGHRHDEQVGRGRPARRRAPVEAVERRAVDQGVGELARAVGAEVGVDDRLASARSPSWPSMTVGVMNSSVSPRA